MKKDLKIGQTIYVVHAKNRISDPENDPKGKKISKIGRKYFELEEERGKFDIESLTESINSTYKKRCYLTEQEILDEREKTKLESTLYNFFGRSYGRTPLSLNSMKEVINIITKDQTK